MANILFHKGSTIDEKCKQTRSLFFVEELFCGDFKDRAPISLRKKVDRTELCGIENSINCLHEEPSFAKPMFKDYKHFKKSIESLGINIKQYFKD